MSETIFHQAVIPTTSLFLIEDLVHDKLDGHTYQLSAISATESSLKPKEEMPYKWVVAKIYQTPKIFINYSFKKCAEEPFSLPLAVEVARKYDVWECWVKRLTLQIHDRKTGNVLYKFLNRPLTKGSDAERFVFNYYRKRKVAGLIKNIPCRHLPLVSTEVLPEKKSHLDTRLVQDPLFIAWLNVMTHGLVLGKVVKKTSGDRFIDLNIEEAQP